MGIAQTVDGQHGLISPRRSACSSARASCRRRSIDRVAGIFLPFGRFAREGRRAAFIAGILLYVIDTLIFVVVRDVLAITLHAFALFCLVKGMQAKDQLDRLPAPRAAVVGLASR